MSQGYNKEAHYYAPPTGQQQATGMILNRGNQQPPAGYQTLVPSGELKQIGYNMSVRPPMAQMGQNFRPGPPMMYNPQPRHPFISQGGTPEYIMQQPPYSHLNFRMQQPVFQYYQPTPANIMAAQHHILTHMAYPNPHMPPPQRAPQTSVPNSIPQQIPTVSQAPPVMPAASVTPGPAATPDHIVIPAQPPIPPAPTPTPAPLPEKRQSKALKIVHPETKEEIKIDKPATKPLPTHEDIPPAAMIFPEALIPPTGPPQGALFGNPKIWMPPQQTPTPVVSAMQEGPAVIPKQTQKKQPKLAAPVPTSYEKPDEPEELTSAPPMTPSVQEQPLEQAPVAEVENIEAVQPQVLERQSSNAEPEEEVGESLNDDVVIEMENLNIEENIEEAEEEPADVLPELEPVPEDEPKDETDRAVLQTVAPVPVPVVVEKTECEKVLEKYGAQLPNFFPRKTEPVAPTPVQAETHDSKKAGADDDNNKENISKQRQEPSTKPKIDYFNGQWSPANVSGKRFYTADQLLELGRFVKPTQKLSVRINPSVQHSLLPTQAIGIEAYMKMAQHSRSHSGGGSNYSIKRLSQHGSGGNKQMHQHINNKMMMMQQQKIMQQHHDSMKLINPMPMSEEVQLRETENAWRPKHLLKEEADAEEDRHLKRIQENFRSILNKLTPENFNKLVHEVKEMNISKQDHLNACISLMFEKAITEPAFSVTYALMCKELSTLSAADGNQKQLFKFNLINSCQGEFEKAHKIKSSKDRGDLLDAELDPVKREQLKEQLDDEDYKARKRAVGTVRFIGELYKIDLLIIRIMHSCIQLLLDSNKMDEESLECLCKLLTTVGKKMEAQQADCLAPTFKALQELISKRSTTKISSRIRFMIQDVIDLRRNKWQPRRNDNNPKTLGQIQREVETEQRNIQILNYQQGGSGMGGNMQNQRNNKYDRRMNQMNYRPKEVAFDSKKMDFARLGTGGSMESDTKLGAPAFFKQWSNSQSTNKFASLNVDDEAGGHMGPPNLPGMNNMIPSFGKGGDRGKPDHRDLYNRDRGGSARNSIDKDRYGGDSHSHYNNRYGNRNQNSSQDNRMQHHSRDNSMTKSGSSGHRSGPPPGLAPVNQNMPSSASSSMLSYQSTSSSGRGSASDYVVASRRPVIECEEPSSAERESLMKEIKKILYDFHASKDRGEAVKECHGIRRGHRWAALLEGAVYLLEGKQDERKSFAQMCIVFVKAGESTLTVDEMIRMLTQLVEIAVDSQVDVPKVWEYLPDFLCPLLHEGTLRVSDITTIAEAAVKAKKGHEFIGKLLSALVSSFGTNITRDLWCLNGNTASIDQFVPYFGADELSEFTQKYASVLAATQAPPNWEVAERSIEEWYRREPSDMRIRQHIDSWGAKTSLGADDPKFLRALTGASIKHSLDHRQNSTTVNEARLNSVSRILKDYLGKREDREVQALCAIQRVVNSLEYPQGLLQSVFAQLYDNHIISGKAFISWRESPAEALNKGVAIKSLTNFFIHVSEETFEDSSCDDEP